MAILDIGDVVATALWPQGDARDPLGVWGMRHGVIGDDTMGSIKVVARVAAARGSEYVYTCYSAIIAQLTGAITADAIKCRLLTNWPDIDVLAGVQGYASAIRLVMDNSTRFTAPIAMPATPMVSPLERFLLLFDPRQTAGDLDIVELELGNNVDLATYSFECYGYWWDRSVLQTPGGPRHPGAS